MPFCAPPADRTRRHRFSTERRILRGAPDTVRHWRYSDSPPICVGESCVVVWAMSHATPSSSTISRRSARPCEPVSDGSLRVWPGSRAGRALKAKPGARAGPAVPLLIQYSPIRQCRRPRRCPDRLPCQIMASRGAAAAASAHYVRLQPWAFARRRRGTVRGTTRRIIPAQLVPSVRLPVPSVQLARVQPVSTLLVDGWPAVRTRSPAPSSAGV